MKIIGITNLGPITALQIVSLALGVETDLKQSPVLSIGVFSIAIIIPRIFLLFQELIHTFSMLLFQIDLKSEHCCHRIQSQNQTVPLDH